MGYPIWAYPFVATCAECPGEPETPQQKVDRLKAEVKECERCREGSAARLAASEKELAAAKKTRGQEVAAEGYGVIWDTIKGPHHVGFKHDGEPHFFDLTVDTHGRQATTKEFRDWFASHIDAEIAREREACAKVMEEQANRLSPDANLSICWNDVKRYYRYRAQDIRARA